AAALGLHYGMTVEEIQQGIAGYVATAMRMEVRTLSNGSLLYDDTYNANPQSMEAGLLTLSRVQGKRRVAVLGQMGELGAQEKALHREVGAAAAKDGIDVLVTVGPLAALIAEEAKRLGLAEVHACKDKEEAKKVLDALYAPDTAFLVKASRAAALEELSRYLEDKT
ncbi:MAG: glutamate ligase domain-containing protein, partial [Lachnospiraceae bacterium]